MRPFQHRLARCARVGVALSAVGAFLIGGASSAGAATISDFGASGLNWVATPTGGTPGWSGSATQNFSNAAGSGVDLSVTASTNMWDGLPNVYAADAPAPGMAPTLRFTNDSGGVDPTTLTFTFSAPVTVSAFTVGSLSSVAGNFENATVTAFDASNNAVAAVGTSTDRFLSGGNSPVTPGGAVVLSSAGNSYQVRGGGAQESGEYDRMTFDFGTTAINRIQVAQVMRSGSGAGDPIVGNFGSETVDQIVFAPAGGYDLALTNTLVSYTPGATQATFRVTVCNQGSVASGAATVSYVVPTGAGYVSPTTANPDGRFLELTLPASLAPGASTTFDVVVGFPDGQTTPFVTAAEISSDSGADVDSTPSVTPAFGAANEDDRVSTADACGVNTDASEDDRDIVALNLSAATTTTGPTTTTTRAPTPGPGVSPATLPVTGTVDGSARNPLALLAVALPVSWMGAVLALRSRRLQSS